MSDQEEFDKINALSREEMGRLWRFSPLGHPWFDDRKPFYKVFKKRFDELGGFNSEISKKIGWDN
jgi:hypothetical protein